MCDCKNNTQINDNTESWIKKYWRPAIAWQYFTICLFDFLIAPILTGIFSLLTNTSYTAWDPLTLKVSGFYHLAMAGIIGVSAWTRGQEKIERLNSENKEEQKEDPR